MVTRDRIDDRTFISGSDRARRNGKRHVSVFKKCQGNPLKDSYCLFISVLFEIYHNAHKTPG